MSPPQSPASPDGVALTWIFDHCLRYPGSYELPLRTMYTLNCNPTKQPLPNNETAFTPRSSTSTRSSGSSQDGIDAAADFRSQLINQIARLPSQPCSLPPSFLTSFLRRCFPAQLECVDFPQALTALDYIKDLETRWKKEMSSAVQRLNIERDDAENPALSELALQYPGVMAWLGSINTKARKLEALYTQIYIGLRRWILINDLLLEPQNKVNHIAMLNTLYPPVSPSSATPTPQLTYQILKMHRDAFFRVINNVEIRGTESLYAIIQQGAPEGKDNSWPLVHDTLENYLNLVNEVIDECVLVNEPSHLEEAGAPYRSKSRKVDSGCSFGSSGTEISVAEGVIDKPLPQFPLPKDKESKGSVLERLGREIRALGPAAKLRNLKKMKSTTTLVARPGSQQSSAPSSIFEITEEKRERLIRDAYSRKNSQSHVSTSDGS
ncbi:hypothetical protein N7462_002488 [Penicillium macrosclerotiorum]|uniref:uncharacterized protein n=1 Tax=Penicillium macrosclerotiorum TaxID=303699 RepID=UPI0025471E42|nr:uncharacterized protein N7462_002488 [Penicillium macrosclerotiorum]KAJ5693065.1 hypothetical protein N7462_002488 [Penicillium macrosclerotiorum]